MSAYEDPKQDLPKDTDPSPLDPSAPDEGLRNFIVALAEQLPDRRVTVSVAVSPEGRTGGGSVPIADGMPASPTKDEKGRLGVQHPGSAGADILVLVGTPDPSRPGPEAVPPSARFTFVGAVSRSAPFPVVPSVSFTATSYIITVYRVQAGGQVFWESLPAGTILWNCPAP